MAGGRGFSATTHVFSLVRINVKTFATVLWDTSVKRTTVKVSFGREATGLKSMGTVAAL